MLLEIVLKYHRLQVAAWKSGIDYMLLEIVFQNGIDRMLFEIVLQVALTAGF